MIRLLFKEIRVSVAGDGPVMILREQEGDRLLAIWVSAAAGAAVLGAVEDSDAAHPTTHDLFMETLSVLDGILDRVEITDEEHGVFDAQLRINGTVIPCRVSDGVALALRGSCGVWVEEAVLERCGVTEASLAQPGTVLGEADDQVEQFREFLDTVTPEDFTDRR